MNPWNREDEDIDQEYDNYEEEDFEEEPEGEWELDPSDPDHPDFDLSEAAGDWAWRPQKSAIVLRRGFVFFVSILLIVVILIPVCLRIGGQRRLLNETFSIATTRTPMAAAVAGGLTVVERVERL